MPIWFPRIARIARSSSRRRSIPWNRIAPEILPGGCGINCIIECAVTDFPQPLSPTIATVSPASTVNETPSTARLTPSGVRKWVCRFSISSKAMSVSLQSLDHARIERIAKSIAKQIDGEDCHREEDRGEENNVGLDLPEGTAFGHDVAPRRDSRRRSRTNEGQDRFDDHGAGANVGRLHRHGGDRVGQNMTQHDHRRTCAGRDGGINVWLLTQRQYDAAHQTRHPRNFRDG